jgi:serine/threonine-protein kinase RsbW
MDANIRVIIPAQSRFLRIARLTAAGVAGDLGFGLQDIEDLRVAIDEMSAVLIDGADPSLELELVYRIDGSDLEVEGRCAQFGDAPELHPVARELLAMTADEFSVESDAEGRRFRLIKRRTAPAPAV